MTTKSIKSQSVDPYIPSSTILPEITLKAVILGVVLTVLMAGSNAYLVLKVGVSISACIPAAVISMAILRLFKKSNILENNIVQTTASGGEVIACALAFTLPALIMIGYWQNFPYFLTTAITIVGGLLGVLMSVPLRRAMIVESDLKFPEGVATAEVLKAGDEVAEGGARGVLLGGLTAAIMKFCQSGLQIFADSINIWTYVGNTVAGITGGFSLALIGAGYIVGIEVALSIMFGGIFAWFIAVPIYGSLYGLSPDGVGAYMDAVGIWNSKIRIIGVGAMVFGGIWMLVELVNPLKQAIKSSLKALQTLRANGHQGIIRTEMDIPITYVGLGAFLLVFPMYYVIHHMILSSNIAVSTTMLVLISVFIAALAYIISFLCASIGSYMTGLLGSSNNPLSGVLIMAVLILSMAILFILETQIDFQINPDVALKAAGLTILISVVVGCAAAVAGDNLQDLKSGQLVGATPWKQQLMLIVGVITSAVVLVPIFQLLFEAYGFGEVLPREGMDPSQALSAPKAALLAALSQAIFTRSMDWTLFMLGGGFAVIVIIIDRILQNKGSRWRCPILAVAVGIYMPLDVTVPLLLGGLIAYIGQNKINAQKSSFGKSFEKAEAGAKKQGLLFASGLIAGEAVVGILLALPFVIYESTDVFSIVPSSLKGWTDIFGLVITSMVLYWFYKITITMKKN